MNDPLAPLASPAEASQPIPELLRLGEKLAQARELAGLTPDDLAQRLRLEPRQLKALEAGDHTLLPDGVFVVAMARRVAGSLQADVEEAIVAVRQSRLMRKRSGTPARPPSPVVEQPGAPKPPLPSSAPPLPSPRPLEPSPRIEEDSPHLASARPPFPWRAAAAALLVAGGLGAAWLFSQRSVAPSHSPSAPPRAEPSPARTAPPAATPGASKPRPPSAAEVPTLRLRASEPSWVEVRQVDGPTLFNGTLTGEKVFPLGGGLEVLAGRPYAVTAAIGAGPASALGGVDDVRWKRFRATEAPSAPPPSPAPSP